MAVRVDTSSWLSGAVLIGDPGFGVRAGDVPTTGIDGPAFFYDHPSFPVDAEKEVAGRITTPPASGTLFAYEDGSFTFTAADGSYTFDYQFYIDGVATGVPQTVSLSIGELTKNAVGTLTSQAAVIEVTAAHLTLHASSGALASQSATVSGTAVHPHVTSGALASQNAIIVGASDRIIPGGEHPTEGALIAAAATLSGIATHLTLHTSSGALVSQSATMAGNALLSVLGSGTGATAAQIWAYEISPGITAAQAIMAIYNKLHGIEAGYDIDGMLRIIAASAAGTSNKVGNQITFKGIDGVTDRIVGTYDDDRNRTSATYDGS